MRSLLLLLALVAAGAAEAGPSISTLWKARGLEAGDALTRLTKTEGDLTDRRVEIMFETAFALHVVQPEIVHKPYTGGGDAFHIMLDVGGDAEQSFLDIVYLYNADGSLDGVRVDRLPKGWMLVVKPMLEPRLIEMMELRRKQRGTTSPQPPRPILVGGDGTMLVFDVNDPFSPFDLMELAKRSAPDGEQPQRPRKGAGKAATTKAAAP